MSIKQGGNTIAGLQDISGKADTDFNNTNMTDYVVESQEPTSANNYVWYRKYKSGWVEQGGIYIGQITTGGNVPIVLPITMSNDKYTCILTANQYSNKYGTVEVKNDTITTTGFSIFAFGTSASDKVAGAFWQVSGMAAN